MRISGGSTMRIASLALLSHFSSLPVVLSDAAPLQLELFPEELAKNRGAQCLDHTPAGYYIRKQDPHKWVIFLEGGGLCVTPFDCIERAKHSNYGSSKDWPSDQTPHQDRYMMTTSYSQLNPFMNFSHVYVPYCSGDTWLGTSSKARADIFGLQMSGHLIIETMLDRLLNLTTLPYATDVILSGTSAGGIGTFHHTDWLAERLAQAAHARHSKPPRVAGVPIEGVFFPEDQPQLYEAFIFGLRSPITAIASEYLKFLQDPWLHPGCVAAAQQKGGAALAECFDISKMFQYTVTPLFVCMNRFDQLEIEDLGLCPKSVCMANAAPSSEGGKFIRYYGAMMNQTVIDMKKSRSGTGFFIPAEYSHDGNFAEFFANTERMIGGVSLRAAIEKWYWARQPVELVEGPLCNDDGPCNSQHEDVFIV